MSACPRIVVAQIRTIQRELRIGRPTPSIRAHAQRIVHAVIPLPWVARDASADHWQDNRKQSLTCAEDGTVLIETDDPCDSAHDRRAPGGRAYAQTSHQGVPAGWLDDCPRRRYPASAMARIGGRRVAWDSAYDDLARIERWLQRRGLRGAAQLSAIAPDWRLVAGMLGRAEFRGLVQQRTGQAMTPEELALEREASRMLNER